MTNSLGPSLEPSPIEPEEQGKKSSPLPKYNLPKSRSMMKSSPAAPIKAKKISKRGSTLSISQWPPPPPRTSIESHSSSTTATATTTMAQEEEEEEAMNYDDLIFAEMLTNTGADVYSLSMKHKIMLIFLRRFTCAFCKETIVDVANAYTTLLMSNCVPVFVHMEKKEQADKFFASFNNAIIQNMIRVADPTGKYFYLTFGLRRAAPSQLANMKVLQRMAHVVMVKGFTNYISPTHDYSRVEVEQMPGVFMIERGKIENEYRYEHIADKPDFLRVLVDSESCTGDSTDCCAQVDSIEDLLSQPKGEQDQLAEMANAFSPVEIQEQQSTTTRKIKEETPQSLKDYIKKQKQEQKKLKKPSSPRLSVFSCFTASSTDNLDSDDESMVKTEEPKTVKDLMLNPKFRPYFKIHTMKEHCNENYLLWTEVVLNYKLITEKEQRQAKAQKIFHAFFNSNSLLEVNTSKKLVEEMKLMLNEEGPRTDLFDRVIQDLEASVLSDSFFRFKRSELYKEMISTEILGPVKKKKKSKKRTASVVE